MAAAPVNPGPIYHTFSPNRSPWVAVDPSKYSPYLQECIKKALEPSLGIGKEPTPYDSDIESAHGRPIKDKQMRQTGSALIQGIRTSARPHRPWKSISDEAFAGVQNLPALTTSCSFPDFAMAQVKGKPAYNEDLFFVHTMELPDLGPIRMMGLSDGHSDNGTVGRCLANQLPDLFADYVEKIKAQDETSVIRKALRYVIKTIHEEIVNAEDHAELGIESRTGNPPGACLLLIIEMANGGTYFANTGDCRAVWVPENDHPIVQYTEDADLQDERFVRSLRHLDPMVPPLQQVGKELRATSTQLAMGREIGNPNSIARPKISYKPPGAKGFMIYSTDGSTFHVKNEEKAKCLKQQLAAGKALHECAATLAQRSSHQDSNDNTTEVIVDQRHPPQFADFDKTFIFPEPPQEDDDEDEEMKAN